MQKQPAEAEAARVKKEAEKLAKKAAEAAAKKEKKAAKTAITVSSSIATLPTCKYMGKHSITGDYTKKCDRPPIQGTILCESHTCPKCGDKKSSRVGMCDMCRAKTNPMIPNDYDIGPTYENPSHLVEQAQAQARSQAEASSNAALLQAARGRGNPTGSNAKDDRDFPQFVEENPLYDTGTEPTYMTQKQVLEDKRNRNQNQNQALYAVTRGVSRNKTKKSSKKKGKK
jgi:hypothetical protein